jgi:tetratricopeptide (TPR) repeat protein
VPKKAQAYLTLAGDLFRSKDFDGALTELRRAEPLVAGSKVQAVVRFNIARCLEELSRFGEAYRAYQRYLNLSEIKDARREKARAAIERLRPSAVGTLRIKCDQPDTVVVISEMGEKARECPFESAEIIIGKYDITAALSEHETARKSVVVKAGAVTDVHFVLVKKTIDVPSQPTTRGIDWAWVGSGLGVAALGVGFHVAAFQTMSDNNEKIVTNSAARDDILDSFRTQRTIAFSSYAVAAVLLGVGYYMSITSDKTDDSTSVTVTPSGFQVRF